MIGSFAAGAIVALVGVSRFSPNSHNAANAAPPAPAAAQTPTPSAPPPAPSQPRTGTADARALSAAFVDVAARLKPAVVKITIERKVGGEGGARGKGGGSENPFEEFFRQFGGGGPSRPRLQHGLGSGFVFDDSNHILTNNHVVEGADRVAVMTSDGRRFTGKVVGADKKDDLAVVKVEGKLNVRPVVFGDSDKLQVGELVMAIGSPLGLDQTVTVGVVSAKGRRLDGTPYAFEDFIQTDASITHGNSGGPLVNMDGQVVGVNSRIAGEGSGIGFSVSSNVARRIAQELIARGRVSRPFIGVSLRDLTPEMAPFFKTEAGVVVQDVVPKGPAAKGGVQSGDVITSVDGQDVKSSEQVVRAVQSHRVGQSVKLALVRNGAKKDLSLTAAEAPNDDGDQEKGAASGGSSEEGKYGFELNNLSSGDAEQMGLKTRKGALVVRVEPGSAADHADLAEGDAIVEVDRKPIGSAAEVKSALRSGGTHLLRVERRGAGSMYVTLSQEK